MHLGLGSIGTESRGPKERKESTEAMSRFRNALQKAASAKRTKSAEAQPVGPVESADLPRSDEVEATAPATSQAQGFLQSGGSAPTSWAPRRRGTPSRPRPVKILRVPSKEAPLQPAARFPQAEPVRRNPARPSRPGHHPAGVARDRHPNQCRAAAIEREWDLGIGACSTRRASRPEASGVDDHSCGEW